MHNINLAQFSKNIFEDIRNIRKRIPLIHNITNFVVMNNTANALLAIGASPIMSHAIEEVADMIKLSQALVINIGTLDQHWLPSMEMALKTAKQLHVPVILDPVGAGATTLRTMAVRELLEQGPPQIIRGNASEILAIANAKQKTKGTDSTESSKTAIEAAKKIAEQYKCTVVISGATDIIVNARQEIHITNGSPLMKKVTGMGCTATALIGAFCTVNQNHTLAAAHAMAVMGVAGELAQNLSSGPGTFQIYFLDALYHLTEETIAEKLRLVEEKTFH